MVFSINGAWALGAVYFFPGVGQVALGVTAAIAIGIAIGATIHYVKKKTKSSSKSKKKKKKVQPKKTYTAKEMESIIKKDGWYQVKSNNGSHRQYKHKRKKGKVTIPWHKTLKKATADSILKQAGLK